MPLKSMIGLKRGTVVLVPHQSAWRDAFEAERSRIITSAAELVIDVQHVGSTSVPGLDAKPIIDIAVAVRSMEEIPTLSEILPGIGWIERGYREHECDYLFVKESAPEFRTHHLHVVEIESLQWCNYLAFRDLLRKRQDIRARYAELKHCLNEKFADDRKSYTAAKEEFISSILDTHEIGGMA